MNAAEMSDGKLRDAVEFAALLKFCEADFFRTVVKSSSSAATLSYLCSYPVQSAGHGVLQEAPLTTQEGQIPVSEAKTCLSDRT